MLKSRRGLDMTRPFPEIARELKEATMVSMALDGELIGIGVGSDGKPSFNAPQNRAQLKGDAEIAEVIPRQSRARAAPSQDEADAATLLAALEGRDEKALVPIRGVRVSLTHLNKVLWPAEENGGPAGPPPSAPARSSWTTI